MNISGEFNILNRTMQAQMETLFSVIETPAYSNHDHSTIISADHFTSLVDQDDRQVYLRSHKYDNHFVNIIIEIYDEAYLEGKSLDEEIKLVISI